MSVSEDVDVGCAITPKVIYDEIRGALPFTKDEFGYKKKFYHRMGYLSVFSCDIITLIYMFVIYILLYMFSLL